MLSEKRNNPYHIRLLALLIGFVLNAFGNSLTIVSNMGAEPWTVVAVNMNKVFPFTVGKYVIFLGVLGAIINQFLLHTVDIPRFAEEVFYIFVFGYVIDLFSDWMIDLDVNHLGIVTRGFLSVIGVTLFCIAISIYQRANIFMHPNDDTSNILRFHYLHNSAIKSQLVDIAPTIVIVALCAIYLGRCYSVNLGTVYSIVCNGFIIKYADRWIWPSLIHNKS